jgi:hypothetical protein
VRKTKREEIRMNAKWENKIPVLPWEEESTISYKSYWSIPKPSKKEKTKFRSIILPYEDIPYTKLSREEIVHTWLRILPFIYFSGIENVKRAHFVQSLYIQKKAEEALENLPSRKAGTNVEERLTSVIKREKDSIRKNGSLSQLYYCKSIGTHYSDMAKAVKGLSIVRDIVEILLRIHEYPDILPQGPSLNAAVRLLFHAPEKKNGVLYKSEKEIRNLWDKYKPAAHIIYGLFHDTEFKPESTTSSAKKVSYNYIADFPEINFLSSSKKSLCLSLSKAYQAQAFLVSYCPISRNEIILHDERRPIWLLPPSQVVSPDKLNLLPFSQIETRILRDRHPNNKVDPNIKDKKHR